MRIEFSLACIAHNLKRIWMIKSQIKGIGVNPTEDGRFDQTFFKSLCGRVKGVWSNLLCSISKSLRHKAIIECFKVNCGTASKFGGIQRHSNRLLQAIIAMCALLSFLLILCQH